MNLFKVSNWENSVPNEILNNPDKAEYPRALSEIPVQNGFITVNGFPIQESVSFSSKNFKDEMELLNLRAFLLFVSLKYGKGLFENTVKNEIASKIAKAKYSVVVSKNNTILNNAGIHITGILSELQKLNMKINKGDFEFAMMNGRTVSFLETELDKIYGNFIAYNGELTESFFMDTYRSFSRNNEIKEPIYPENEADFEKFIAFIREMSVYDAYFKNLGVKIASIPLNGVVNPTGIESILSQYVEIPNIVSIETPSVESEFAKFIGTLIGTDNASRVSSISLPIKKQLESIRTDLKVSEVFNTEIPEYDVWNGYDKTLSDIVKLFNSSDKMLNYDTPGKYLSLRTLIMDKFFTKRKGKHALEIKTILFNLDTNGITNLERNESYFGNTVSGYDEATANTLFKHLFSQIKDSYNFA